MYQHLHKLWQNLKTKPQTQSSQPISEAVPELSRQQIEANIIQIVGDQVFIGGELIKDDLLRTVIEDAKFMKSSRLWDIMRATILDEANRMALVSSKEWDHVLSAKMLKHYEHVITNVIHSLVAKG